MPAVLPLNRAGFHFQVAHASASGLKKKCADLHQVPTESNSWPDTRCLSGSPDAVLRSGVVKVVPDAGYRRRDAGVPPVASVSM